jgi:trehalose synthase
MIKGLRDNGVRCIWRCHIGTEVSYENQWTRDGWNFLKPYVCEADHFVFTMESLVPNFVNQNKVSIIHPSIDAFSPKNQDMSLKTAQSILNHVGLLEIDEAKQLDAHGLEIMKDIVEKM